MSTKKTEVEELQQEISDLKIEVETLTDSLKDSEQKVKDGEKEIGELERKIEQLENADIDYSGISEKEAIEQLLAAKGFDKTMFNEMKCEVFFANIEKFKLEELEAFVNRFSLV